MATKTRKSVRPDDVHMAEMSAVSTLDPKDQDPEVVSGPIVLKPDGLFELGIASEEDTEAPQETPEEAVERLQEMLHGRVARTATPAAPHVVPEIKDAATGKLIAELQKQIEDLQGQVVGIRQQRPVEETEGGESGYPHQYYKKAERLIDGKPALDSGWVTSGPGGATPTGRRDVGSYAKYMTKGMRPLTKYGPAPLPSQVYKTPGGSLLPLLQAGGAKELPVSQVLAYNWHVRPPLPGLRFPQVDAVSESIRHFECDDCDYEFWTLADDEEAYKRALRHLRQDPKKDGRHGMTRQEARATLADLGFPPRRVTYEALPTPEGEGAPLLEALAEV